ncbi:MAG: 4'-phosphopantetheinyl transferase superfamily protein [Kineosporiaceae bacterium]|nr:4'-phosphopantetheinyl transferase superfamily protein [Kineosporiaceae bacterium]
MITGIVPARVAAVERFVDEPDVPLFAAEEGALVGTPLARRNEYATVRHCARLALATLAVDAVAIVAGDRGSPVWPLGVVGSMTHCSGYRAAAVARDAEVRTIGIDAEPHAPLSRGVLHHVSSADERSRLEGLIAAAPGIAWDRLLFSAKESVYKAWFPLVRQPLGFKEADVAFCSDDGTFVATIHRRPTGCSELGRVYGSWAVSESLVATAVVVAERRSAARPIPPP